MSSGIKVAEQVKTLLQQMKVNKTTDDPKKRIRIVTLCICEEIQVDEIYKEEDLPEGGNVYKFLQTLMKDEDCKYIVYDCHYETKLGKKEELVFIMWSSDNAKTKLKMPYASSKSYLKKVMDAKHEFEFHSLEDIAPDCFAECISRLAKEEITSLEGEGVCCRKK